jgi:antitoxin ParD1/3/4/toxin ParE1/3/4
MRRLRIQPQARVDLLEIWHFIARDSIESANHVGEQLELAVQGLREMPGKGHVRPDVKVQRYRFWCVFSYVIAYQFDDRTIVVERVVHGRRNFRKLFKR